MIKMIGWLEGLITWENQTKFNNLRLLLAESILFENLESRVSCGTLIDDLGL